VEPVRKSSEPVDDPVIDLPKIRPDIGASTIAAFLGGHLATPFVRLEALYDYSSGMEVQRILKKHSISIAMLQEWIRALNANGAVWLSSGQPPEFLRTRCRSLLSLGLPLEDTSTAVGVTLDFVKAASGAAPAKSSPRNVGRPARTTSSPAAPVAGAVQKAKTTRLIANSPNLTLPDERRREAEIAAQCHSEPLRTYANIVFRLYGNTYPSTIIKDYEVTLRDLELIVSTFTSAGVEGLAMDPLNVARTAKGWRDAKEIAFRFTDEGRKIPTADRIRSYKHRALPGGDDALEAVALAADGLFLSEIMSKLDFSADEIRSLVDQFNRSWSTSFVDAKRDTQVVKAIKDEPGRLDQLLSLSMSVPDKALARNIAIVCAVAQGRTLSFVCDHRHVSHQFVSACLREFERRGVAGLASMPANFIENERVAPRQNEGSAYVNLDDDLKTAGRRHVRLRHVDPHPTRSPAVHVLPPPSSKPSLPMDERPKSWQTAHVPEPLGDVALHLPRPGEAGENDVLVARLEKAVSIEAKDRVASAMKRVLDQASLFGDPGLVLLWEDSDGGRSPPVDRIVGGDGISVDHCMEVVQALIDGHALAAGEVLPHVWRIVPFFKTRIGSASRLHTMRSLHEFERLVGRQEVLLWVAADIEMHPSETGWTLGCEKLLSLHKRVDSVRIGELLGKS
jgi:hypothetical protein